MRFIGSFFDWEHVKTCNLMAKNENKTIVLVGTYKGDQLTKWPDFYNYPITEKDKIKEQYAALINELWLFKGKTGPKTYVATFVGVKTREELITDYAYSASGKAHAKKYLLFKIEEKIEPSESADKVIVRLKDFSNSPATRKQLKAFLESAERADSEAGLLLPMLLIKLSPNQLAVCESAYQMTFWDTPEMRDALVHENLNRLQARESKVCKVIASYSQRASADLRGNSGEVYEDFTPIRVIELFAGVGGFRVGLERASKRYETVWNNQWEPSTKRQDASIVYQNRFGPVGHSNDDISTVTTSIIPEADLLVGGFPCQDYSVATTLKNSGGIEGKKGVLWWQIHRILKESVNPPPYLFLENVDRLLKSPASQRGRDFAIILASLSDLGYCVEWRVINAAEYGMPQRRRRTYIVAYRETTKLAKEATLTKDTLEWVLEKGVIASAFESKLKEGSHVKTFEIEGSLVDVTQNFNVKSANSSPFKDAGFMRNRIVCTADVTPVYDGERITLGQLLEDEANVPAEFFIEGEELEAWKYLKGPKSEMRTTTEGYEYHYTEGGMAFPDSLDKPSRTIITGEGGKSPSRFKHVVLTPSGRYRRLLPLELERLNMFPDNHTDKASDGRRAFLMGNALVTGIVERIGLVLKNRV